MIRFLDNITLELSKVYNGKVIEGQEEVASFTKGQVVPGAIREIPNDENGCVEVVFPLNYIAIVAPGIAEWTEKIPT